MARTHEGSARGWPAYLRFNKGDKERRRVNREDPKEVGENFEIPLGDQKHPRVVPQLQSSHAWPSVLGSWIDRSICNPADEGSFSSPAAPVRSPTVGDEAKLSMVHAFLPARRLDSTRLMAVQKAHVRGALATPPRRVGRCKASHPLIHPSMAVEGKVDT